MCTSSYDCITQTFLDKISIKYVAAFMWPYEARCPVREGRGDCPDRGWGIFSYIYKDLPKLWVFLILIDQWTYHSRELSEKNTYSIKTTWQVYCWVFILAAGILLFIQITCPRQTRINNVQYKNSNISNLKLRSFWQGFSYDFGSFNT